MNLFVLLFWILLLGFIVYAVYAWGTRIQHGFKVLIYCVCMAVAILITLNAFGLLNNLNLTVPQIKH